MSRFCTKCGSPYQEGAKFCGKCGAPWISEPEAAPNSQPQAAPGAPSQAARTPKPNPAPQAAPKAAPKVTPKAAPNPAPQAAQKVPKARKSHGFVWAIVACLVVLVVAVGLGQWYYVSYLLPQTAMNAMEVCDQVMEQVGEETGAGHVESITGQVHTPTAYPKWGLFSFHYRDVQCEYTLSVDGEEVSVSAVADFTTGLLPGSVGKLEFEDLKYPAELLQAKPEEDAETDDPEEGEEASADAADNAGDAGEESAAGEDTPWKESAAADDEPEYIQMPAYHQGEWYSADGAAWMLNGDYYLIDPEGDGITSDLTAEFVLRGSDERHTLRIPADGDAIYIDGQSYTREPPQEDYLLPDSDQRYLTEEDLADLTHEECCLARNEIYARHGRKFTTEEIAAYFAGKDWYEGTIDPQVFDSHTDQYFNDYERKNIQLIQQYELEKFGSSYY